MEERIIERDDERLIKIKHTQDGETDALEEGAEMAENEGEEEIVIELPEGEYDEDLVGLTPSQLRTELERRKKAEEEARAECEKMLSEGRLALKGGKYDIAEGFFAQALVYDPENAEAQNGLWEARTHGLSDDEALLTARNAQEFSVAGKGTRAHVLKALGASLNEKRAECAREEQELAPRVETAQEERRAAFLDNRRYYLVRFWVILGVVALMAIACGVSASFIYTVNTAVPVILTAVFGGLAAVVLGVLVFYCRKLYVAQRLCRENEKLSSTGDGARLEYLRERLAALDLVLGE